MRIFSEQNTFTSGELDPRMRARPDSGAYANGAAALKNWALLTTGGVMNRPGTWYLADVGGAFRLVPFDFDEDERYLVAFVNTGAKIYQIDSVGGVALVATLVGAGWTTAQLYDLTFAQLADVMIVCHPSHQPHIIRRTGLTTFTLGYFGFSASLDGSIVQQPYYKFADDTTTLTPSGVTGAITLTASAPSFDATYVGTRLRIFKTEIEITGYTSSTVLSGTVQGTIRGEYDPEPLKAINGSTTVEVTHVQHGLVTGQSITLSGANAVGGIAAASLNGARTITVIDDNRYSFVAGAAATSSEDGGGPSVRFTPTSIPIKAWDEQVFSVRNGYPRAITFHEQRLWFGGTTEKPDGIWSSHIGNYFNFAVGTGAATESIQVTVGADDISSVRHLVSNRHLQVFTGSGEFYAASAEGSTLTPATMSLKRQTPYGISNVTPWPFDGATLFVQNSRTAVREFMYSDAERAYSAGSISSVSSHLIKTPKDMAVLYGSIERPEQYALFVNTDGTMAVFHSNRAEKLAGWTPWETCEGHTFETVTSVGNNIFVGVKRGGTYCLERFDDGGEEGTTVDCSIAYDQGGVETTTWTVDFPNDTVEVIGRNVDGEIEYALGEYTTVGTTLELESPAAYIVVGYRYDLSLRTLPPKIELPNGPRTGELMRISAATISLYGSLACRVSGQTMILRQVTDDLSLPVERFTGRKRFPLLGYRREPYIEINVEHPLPVRVLGLMLEVQI